MQARDCCQRVEGKGGLRRCYTKGQPVAKGEALTRHAAACVVVVSAVAVDKEGGGAAAQEAAPPPAVVFESQLEVGEADCDEGRHDDEDDVHDEQNRPDDVHLGEKGR